MKISQEIFDKLAIGISVFCTLNCLFLPSLLVLSSGYLATQIDSEQIHALILIFALPLSMFALWQGYRNHKRLSFFLIGITGLIIMILAFFFGEIVFGKLGEQFFTLLGSVIVVYAHYKNFTTCNALDCECHNLESS